MDDIFVREIDGFPGEVEAVTVTDANGDYNIYLNRRLPECRRRRACSHELSHILLGHFENGEPLAINELEADKKFLKKRKKG
jgi:Zn-dependent peptidase ImmA (M78 family)